MAMRVVGFSNGGRGTTLERFLCKNQLQHTQRKLLNFENRVNGKVKNQSDLKNYVIKKMYSWIDILQWKKLRRILIIFDIKNHILALLGTSTLHLFSKFNNFLWVCWFMSKNLFNFVPPDWKLDNLYYLIIPHLDPSSKKKAMKR